jgi:hypothetical protein
MRVIKPRKKAKSKTKKNPKKGRPKMAKKRHHKKASVKANPKKKRTYRNPKRKSRRNPVVIGKRRKARRNPSFNAKGILEQIKPIAIGALGALIVSKAISYIPLKPEQENLKPWVKLGAGIAIAYFGRKYKIAQLGGTFVATLAVRDMLAEKFPVLVNGTDDFEVVGENELLENYGRNNFLGSQVNFAGEGFDSEPTMGDQILAGQTGDYFQMDGF